MEKIKAVIFDFDWTLADTYKYAIDTFKKTGHNVDDAIFVAHHDWNVYEHPAISITDKSMWTFFQQYITWVDEVKPFFCAEQIKKLHDKYLFIVSSNAETAIQKFLLHNDLDYFDEILGVNFSKSKIKKFEHLIKIYNLNTDECLFVTDTLWDILEAKEMWLKTLAVDFGFHDRKRLEKGKPLKIVSSFDDVIKYIKEND